MFCQYVVHSNTVSLQYQVIYCHLGYDAICRNVIKNLMLPTQTIKICNALVWHIRKTGDRKPRFCMYIENLIKKKKN